MIDSTARSTAPPRRAGEKRRLEKHKARAGWVLLAPALLHSLIFLALPTVIVVWLSLTDARIAGEGDWVGVQNYLELITDSRFQDAFIRTLIYTVVVVPGGMIIALAIAIALNQQIRARGLFRTLFYIPVITSPVAVSAVWLWIYNPSAGLANEALAFFGLSRSGWLTDPSIALPALMVVGLWQSLGARMIIYLAALQGVSNELVEAARLDGANAWQVFRNVTWPAVSPVNFFVLVTSIASSFQVFDLVYVMTQGGPANSTTVLVFDIFTNAFERLHIGYASAETVLMFLFIGIMIFLGRFTQPDRKGD
ncbi:carbohydrate ABC transporter permease [Brachybacterium alimentarium]|uniref:carbohydrate ABC transporter permease n=1 Tax=Brachybacterium alimentarium TaxID=47845 RepID=UPI003FD5AE59